RVSDSAAAAHQAAALGNRIFLTVGRQGVAAFAGLTEPWFLIRAIDPPTGPVPPRHELLLARGPFELAEEQRLLADHRIEVLVTRDSGGAATAAKLAAATSADIPVVMIDRPALPDGAIAVSSVGGVLSRLRAILQSSAPAHPG